MKKVKYVFVILVYKNISDLNEYITNLETFNLNKVVIVVNSYYDESSKKEIEKFCSKKSCIFLNVENRGYGYGNNRGIEYANINYKYTFLIVSNPDILIKKFSDLSLSDYSDAVIGPMIQTLENKNQNPFWVLENKFTEKMIYRGYKDNSKSKIYFGIIVNKIIRELFLVFIKFNRKSYKKVFAIHGSFLIFPQKVLKRIGLPYDENIFLFSEEAHLAHFLKRENVHSYITKDIEILHKEDGSISMSDINIMNEVRKSVITYYENYFYL